MSWYVGEDGKAREIDDALVAAWIAAGNPKAGYWAQISDRPGDQYEWNGTGWVLPAVPPEGP